MSQENDQPEQTETEDFEENIQPYTAFSEELDAKDDALKDIEDDLSHVVESDEQQIIFKLQEQLDVTKDQMIRAMAEADNARKRAIKEREDASKYAVSKFSKGLLPVADNLRRALDSIPQEILESSPQIKNLTDGIEATERELLRCFESNNIKKIEPLDDVFDPNFHEVMFETPIPGKKAGIIIQVIEPGYTLNGRLIRPARVGISKDDNSAQETPPHSEPGQTLNTEA